MNNLLRQEPTVQMPTAYGEFEMTAFTQLDTREAHLALCKGSWVADEAVLVRLHSSCITGDIFGSQRCDCGEQLHQAMELIEKEAKGLVLYLMQKFLVIQTAFIGDVVLATALIEKLHNFYPAAKIDFLLRKGNENLLANHPYLNEVFIFFFVPNQYFI